MSPRRMLLSCGSSSRLVRRSQRPTRGYARDRQALDRVNECARADEVEQARDAVDLHVAVELVDRPDRLRGVRIGVVGKGDDEPLDVEVGHESLEVFRLTEQREM